MLRNVLKLLFRDNIVCTKSVSFRFEWAFDIVRAELVRDVLRSIRFLEEEIIIIFGLPVV